MGSRVGNRGSIKLSLNTRNMSNGGAGNNGGRSGDNQNKQSTGDEVKSKRKSARIAQLEADRYQNFQLVRRSKKDVNPVNLDLFLATGTQYLLNRS